MNTPMFIGEEHNHKERQISFFTHLKYSLSVCVGGGAGNSWKINWEMYIVNRQLILAG